MTVEMINTENCIKEHINNIKYNEEFKTRSKFVFETVLSVPIGAIAGFLFDNKWRLAFDKDEIKQVNLI
ncbi:MAG: hypothetical protein HDR06_17655 [Lachnospiraceae bacterium]|nr:hypothetical protein [Lachnospiraceae bacterium]